MKKFFKERYHLHLLIGICLGFALTTLLTIYAQFSDFPPIIGFLVMGFFLTGISFAREWYFSYKDEVPFDVKDIFWTAIGGVVGGIIYYLV